MSACHEDGQTMHRSSSPPDASHWRPKCKGPYGLSLFQQQSILNLSNVNHSLLLYVHIAKTAGSTMARALSKYRGQLREIPCVAGANFTCDQTERWRRRHLFLEFHDGRRAFGPHVWPILSALREKYRLSGGRVLLWTTLRPVIPRTFSHFYMWSSQKVRINGHRAKVQLSFDEWMMRTHLNAQVHGIGAPFDTSKCSDHALDSLIQRFDAIVHMDCTSKFLTQVVGSITRNKTRVWWIIPGRGRIEQNRTKYTWSTIGPCARRALLNRTWCDARLYSRLFPDDRLHRKSWWENSSYAK
jgi:hypothetical protein